MNKEAQKLHSHNYYLKNRERIIKNVRKYYLTHRSIKGKWLVKQGLRRCLDCGEIKPISSFYKSKNLPSGFGYRCVGCPQKKAYKNGWSKEFYLEYLKEYKAKMLPEVKRAYSRRRKNSRRARELNAEGDFAYKEWLDLVKSSNHRCIICGGQEPFIGQLVEHLTVDHIIPLSKNGSNYITNIQPLCFNCNMRKGVRIIKKPPCELHNAAAQLR